MFSHNDYRLYASMGGTCRIPHRSVHSNKTSAYSGKGERQAVPTAPPTGPLGQCVCP